MSLASTPLTVSTPIYVLARAALGRRLVALLIDVLVLSLVDGITNSVFGVMHPAGASTIVLLGGGVNSYATVTTADWPWLILVWISYYAILEGLFGATVGKALARVRVTDLQGRRVSWQGALLRNVVRPVDAFPRRIPRRWRAYSCDQNAPAAWRPACGYGRSSGRRRDEPAPSAPGAPNATRRAGASSCDSCGLWRLVCL